MDLVLITKTSETAERQVSRFPADEVIVGGADTCDLSLAGLAAVALSLTCGTTGDLHLHRKDPDLSVTVNEEPMLDPEAVITNGDVLHVGKYEIRVTVAFDRSDQRATTGLVPVLTMLVIFLVIAVEISVATWLPAQITGQELWADEYVRQKTLNRLDYLRGRIAYWEGLADAGENSRQTLQLIKEEADRMAAYIREHEDKMSINQYNTFRTDIDRFHAIFERVRKDKQFPPADPIDLTPALKSVLEEE